MRAILPLLFAVALPLVLHTAEPSAGEPENICARPSEKLQASRAAAADDIVSQWYNAPGATPLFVMSQACSWNCGGGSNGCTDNLAGFLRYVCRNHAFQFGLSSPDISYHDATFARFGGRMMTPPEALIKASLDYPTVPAFKKELTKLGYKFVEFMSTSVPNPPQGYWRLLILIETDDYDQWYQIATTDMAPRLLGRNVDVGVVQKRDEEGRTLSPARWYMNGYSRLMYPKVEWEQEGLGNIRPLNRCIMCHPSGLRGIFPQQGTVPPEDDGHLRYIQKKLDVTTTNGFGGFYDPPRLGPPMGLIDPPSRPALLARCASNQPAASIPKIAHAMNCVKCHDGRFRGFLHGGTDFATIAHKVTFAAKDGIMPPAEELTGGERQALSSCLRMEYQEQLRSWMNEKPCENVTARASVPAEPRCNLR